MSSGLGSPYSSPPSAAINGGLQPNSPQHCHHHHQQQQEVNSSKGGGSCNLNSSGSGGFQMPLHYPRYKKSDYEKMPEWQLELLLSEYGLPAVGDLHQKRTFAIGAFLWPDQL